MTLHPPWTTLPLKPTLLIDMDGVFCDWIAGYYMVLESKFPHARPWFPDPENITEFYVSDCLLDDRGKHIEQLICTDADLYRIAPPIPGALDGMRSLRAKCLTRDIELFICTAPHPANKHCYSQKAVWVAEKLGEDWLDSLIITRDKTVVSADVLLDDKPNPIGGQAPNWDHVLFTQPCNRSLDKPRIDDWSPASIDFLIQQTLKNWQDDSD